MYEFFKQFYDLRLKMLNLNICIAEHSRDKSKLGPMRDERKRINFRLEELRNE